MRMCCLRKEEPPHLLCMLELRLDNYGIKGWNWAFAIPRDSLISFFSKDFMYLFLERGREGEREGEKPRCGVASPIPSTGDLAHNPGMCPDWDSNQRPFDLQAGTHSTEPHQPGQNP